MTNAIYCPSTFCDLASTMVRIVIIFRPLLICIYILSVTNFSYDPCQILAKVNLTIYATFRKHKYVLKPDIAQHASTCNI
jgi:hypothetical protein